LQFLKAFIEIPKYQAVLFFMPHLKWENSLCVLADVNGDVSRRFSNGE